jgi:hypothetical protein
MRLAPPGAAGEQTTTTSSVPGTTPGGAGAWMFIQPSSSTFAIVTNVFMIDW